MQVVDISVRKNHLTVGGHSDNSVLFGDGDAVFIDEKRCGVTFADEVCCGNREVCWQIPPRQPIERDGGARCKHGLHISSLRRRNGITDDVYTSVHIGRFPRKRDLARARPKHSGETVRLERCRGQE